MKKIIFGFILVAIAACEYKDIAPHTCYLATEYTPSKAISYSYDSKNVMTTYAAANVLSSVLTYNDAGNIISELDNGNLQINYDYNQNNRLILWTQSIVNYPAGNFQIKFTYNSAGQNILKQSYRYDVNSSSYYLTQYVELSYSSTNTKSYSQRKTYNAASTLLYTENFLWDNHPNPYLANPFFINEPPPSNNITQYTFTPASGVPNIVTYTYTYNSNGFPLTQTVPGYATIAYYSYTNCN
jgi:YD repeat-containing protein